MSAETPMAQRVEPREVVLSCRDLTTGYHGLPAIHEVSLEVHAGEVVALVGANGAGKTTTLMALAGRLRPQSGEVCYLGSPRIQPQHRRALDGIATVADDRTVLRTLTVAENLRLAPGPPEEAFALFPELDALRHRRVELLSGGEQQMLSLARALAVRPKALLADELSLGLAPQITQRLHKAVRTAATNGTAVVIVEQQVNLVLNTADRIYVFNRGRTVLQGSSEEIRDQLEHVEAQYLGTSTVDGATEE